MPLPVITMYDTLLGSAMDIPVAAMTIPVGNITMTCKNVAGEAVLLDDYRLYATYVAADFYRYDATTGMPVAETDKTAGSTAYRLSWLNGTAQEKSYTVMAAYYDGDTKVSEEVVQEIKMAPYADGVAMGVVEHKQEGKTMQLYLQDNNAAAGGATNPGTEAPENATVPETAPATDTGEQPSNNMLVIIIAAAAVVVVAVIVVIVVSKKKKAAPKIPETAEENTEE